MLLNKVKGTPPRRTLKQKMILKHQEELERWLNMFLRIESVCNDLRRLYGATPESEVVSAMYDSHAAYTDLLAETVGDNDAWLSWYLWENECGKRGLEAKAPSWKRARKIKTLRDLEEIIAA